MPHNSLRMLWEEFLKDLAMLLYLFLLFLLWPFFYIYAESTLKLAGNFR